MNTLYRHHIYVLVSLVGFLNAIIKPVSLHILEFGWLDSALQTFGISIVVWGIWLLVIKKLFKPSKELATKQDILVAILTLIAFHVTSSTLCWLILACFAVVIIYSSNQHRLCGQILLALALREPVSQVVFQIFTPSLLAFDSVMVKLFLSMLSLETNVSGNLVSSDSGYNLFILKGCSSFINLSYALLCWFVIGKHYYAKLHFKSIVSCIAVILVIPTLNYMRLSLMTQGMELFNLIHGSAGNNIFNAITLPLVIIISLWGVGYVKSKA